MAAIIEGKNPIHDAESVAAYFSSRAAAEKAKADIIAAGVSYEAVKIIDDREAPSGGEGRRHLVEAHVPRDHAQIVRAILQRDGDIRDGD